MKAASGREARRPCQPETGAVPVPPMTVQRIKRARLVWFLLICLKYELHNWLFWRAIQTWMMIEGRPKWIVRHRKAYE